VFLLLTNISDPGRSHFGSRTIAAREKILLILRSLSDPEAISESNGGNM